MNADIRISTVGPAQRNPLIDMYEHFDPLGEALGLPPRDDGTRCGWIEAALDHEMNLVAFSPAGTAAGHCFLVGDQTGSAELAIFVHQEFRRRGVATALVRAVLERAVDEGLRRIWSLTGSDNTAALRLQEKCGFRITNAAFYGVELEISLPAAPCLWQSGLSDATFGRQPVYRFQPVEARRI